MDSSSICDIKAKAYIPFRDFAKFEASSLSFAQKSVCLLLNIERYFALGNMV